MAVSIRVAPQNSLVLISDPRGGEIPNTMRGLVVSATASCIAVGTLPEVDGDTEIVLGGNGDPARGENLAYEGILETPSRKVAVYSVLEETFLEAPTNYPETKVRVWVNDSWAPDRIVIGIT